MRFLSMLGLAAVAVAQLTTSSLEKHVDSVTLSKSFNPIKEAYWTGYPHHRRTPFAVSPDGKSAYLAYLDSSETGVHIQPVDPTTFAAAGDLVTIEGGKEAGGLVAHNDGFAILTNEALSGVKDPVAVVYRYTNGKQTFKTYLGGPGVDDGQAMMSPDMNGDLVFSEKAGYYAAYIVVTAYEGPATGHFGDAIRYVDTAGKLTDIPGASSSWGCSHNTGIAFEEADEPPFASICAEDQGAIWLNTKTRGMTSDGVKISNEHVVNGGANEAMGGMSGSYSSLARFVGADSYVFSWVSRGAVDLTANEWMGAGYTTSKNRTNNRNVAVALFSDKNTLVGDQATSEVGAADGDRQVNWLTSGPNDCSNAHAAAFDGSRALVSWEEISDPVCDFDAMGCRGAFAGTKFQMVASDGKKLGEAVSADDTYVAGDMVTMPDGRICWPYVAMDWKLDGPQQGSPVSKMSFACMSAGSGSGSGASASAAAASSAVAAAADPTFPAGTAPEPIFSTISGSALPSTSAPAASAPAVSSTPAVVSSSAPAGAPEPIYSTISGSALPSTSAPAVSSVPAVVSSSTPAGAPEPIYSTISGADSATSSAPAKVPAASASSSFSAPAGAPEPIYSTISGANPASSSAPAKVPAASAPAIVSSSAPAGAPEPIYSTISGADPTTSSAPAKVPAASASSSFSAPAGAPEPIYSTISGAEPAASSAPASASASASASSSASSSFSAPAGAPEPIYSTICSADPAASSAPSEAPATTAVPSKTRSREHTRTRKCNTRKVIQTIYVTARQ